MSAPAEHDDRDLPHEGPIKTWKQLVVAVFFSFVVPIFAIVLLVKYVASSPQPAAGSDAFTPQSVAARIAPVGRVVVKDVTDPAALASGEQVYNAQCIACHGAGVAGAPKIGDAAAWAERLKTGYDALLTSSLKGKGAMGPQGGGDYTDFEIARAVVFLANKSGGKFDDPKPPAPVTATTATTAAAPAAAAAPAPAAAAAPAVAPAAAAAPAAAPATTVAAGAAAPAAAAAPATAGSPPALYTQVCAVCHIAGVANAPKLGDKAAWEPRLPQGIDGLTKTVITGKGAMPPRGGSTANDADIKAAVAYMVGTVK